MFDDDRIRNRDRIRRRARRRRDNPWTHLVWGAAILAAGIIGWLDHTGQLRASDYFEWWPLLLIALGLAHLPERQWVSVAVLTAAGILFLPSNHVHLFSILGVWPLLISAAGVTLIGQALRPKVNDAAGTGAFHAVAVMGGVGRSVASNDFGGGDAVAIMGGCEIKLGDAKITTEAVIDVLAFWGGIEIQVPRGWAIENHVLALLGGFADKTDEAPAGAPKLIFRGSAIMGGVEVKHPKA
jgi:hypothetical protein